uniref:F-box domain-containing protein n=1 Tax=Leersia perrieri TaxID=77586 RepID=A0A0D9VEA9_9ORYZ
MAAPHPLLEDDDLLGEILLRLPPRPSSLPRASAFCSRWRRLLTSDTSFLRRFRARHRRDAPLLGVFEEDVFFTPTMDPPDRIPSNGARFSLPLDQNGEDHRVVGCRDGLVLILEPWRRYFLVWDPVSDELRHVAFPPELDLIQKAEYNGAVFRAGGGGFPFEVVLVGSDKQRAFGCVYSSEASKWGNLISSPLPPLVNGIDTEVAGVLIGDSLYWQFSGIWGGHFLQFDLNKQRLAMIDVPMNLSGGNLQQFCVMPAEDGSLGINATIWRAKTAVSEGIVSGWMMEKTIDLDKLLSLNLQEQGESNPFLVGLAEDHNVIFLGSTAGVFMVHLKSMEFKKVSEVCGDKLVFPFAGVYAAGMAINDGNVEDD